MTDPEIRRAFIETLDETVEIAEASGHFAAQKVLLALSGAMEAGVEGELGTLCDLFSQALLYRIRKVK